MGIFYFKKNLIISKNVPLRENMNMKQKNYLASYFFSAKK